MEKRLRVCTCSCICVDMVSIGMVKQQSMAPAAPPAASVRQPPFDAAFFPSALAPAAIWRSILSRACGRCTSTSCSSHTRKSPTHAETLCPLPVRGRAAYPRGREARSLSPGVPTEPRCPALRCAAALSASALGPSVRPAASRGAVPRARARDVGRTGPWPAAPPGAPDVITAGFLVVRHSAFLSFPFFPKGNFCY